MTLRTPERLHVRKLAVDRNNTTRLTTHESVHGVALSTDMWHITVGVLTSP
jgi:hypothetical protein